MSIDWHIELPSPKSRTEIIKAIRKYLDKAGEVRISERGARIILKGKPSFYLERRETGGSERFIRLLSSDQSVTLITSEQDEYTNGVACQLQDFLARVFDGFKVGP